MTEQNFTTICKPKHKTFIDLEGKRFGRLLVTGYLGRVGASKSKNYWQCLCDCGTVKAVIGRSLRKSKSSSCGCLLKEVAGKYLELGRKPLPYGLKGSRSPEYLAYRSARDRCNNPNIVGYKHYGGRGIKFKFTSFEEFFKVLGNKPTAEHSLDRINNDGHYEPSNVRWATRQQQRKNQRARPKKDRADLRS